MDLTKYPMDEQECMLDLESCKFQPRAHFHTEFDKKNSCFTVEISEDTLYRQVIQISFTLHQCFFCAFCDVKVQIVLHVGWLMMSGCPVPRWLLFRGHCLSLVRESETHPRSGQTGAVTVHHHRLSLWHRDVELQIWSATSWFSSSSVLLKPNCLFPGGVLAGVWDILGFVTFIGLCRWAHFISIHRSPDWMGQGNVVQVFQWFSPTLEYLGKTSYFISYNWSEKCIYLLQILWFHSSMGSDR